MRVSDEGDEIGRGRLFFFFKQFGEHRASHCFFKTVRSTESWQSPGVETEEWRKLIRFIAHLSIQVYCANVIIYPFTFSTSSNPVIPQNNKSSRAGQSKTSLSLQLSCVRCSRGFLFKPDTDVVFCRGSTSCLTFDTSFVKSRYLRRRSLPVVSNKPGRLSSIRRFHLHICCIFVVRVVLRKHLLLCVNLRRFLKCSNQHPSQNHRGHSFPPLSEDLNLCLHGFMHHAAATSSSD